MGLGGLPCPISPAHGELKGNCSAVGVGWVRSHGAVGNGNVCSPPQPSGVHPPLPTCLDAQRAHIVLGVKALDDSHSKGMSFGTVLVGFGVSDVSFQLKKRGKKRSYRTASAWREGQDCQRPHIDMLSHTYTRA